MNDRVKNDDDEDNEQEEKMGDRRFAVDAKGTLKLCGEGTRLKQTELRVIRICISILLTMTPSSQRSTKR